MSPYRIQTPCFGAMPPPRGGGGQCPYTPFQPGGSQASRGSGAETPPQFCCPGARHPGLRPVLASASPRLSCGIAGGGGEAGGSRVPPAAGRWRSDIGRGVPASDRHTPPPPGAARPHHRRTPLGRHPPGRCIPPSHGTPHPAITPSPIITPPAVTATAHTRHPAPQTPTHTTPSACTAAQGHPRHPPNTRTAGHHPHKHPPTQHPPHPTSAPTRPPPARWPQHPRLYNRHPAPAAP